jgi:histone H3/H4
LNRPQHCPCFRCNVIQIWFEMELGRVLFFFPSFNECCFDSTAYQLSTLLCLWIKGKMAATKAKEYELPQAPVVRIMKAAMPKEFTVNQSIIYYSFCYSLAHLPMTYDNDKCNGMECVLLLLVQFAKETKHAFAQAGGLFILYLTQWLLFMLLLPLPTASYSCYWYIMLIGMAINKNSANDICKSQGKTTVTAEHVLAAVQELEFDDFTEPLTEFLDCNTIYSFTLIHYYCRLFPLI